MVARIWAVLYTSAPSYSSGLGSLVDVQNGIDFANELHANG